MIASEWPRHRVALVYIWQDAYPMIAGAGVFLAVIWRGDWMACAITAHHIDLTNFYTAIAGLFAIITGFLATFYGSIQAIVDTRLHRISRSAVFLRFIRYIKVATKVGFGIAILSIPFIVFSPSTDGN